MPVYQFICSTHQGKEVRGECKAKNEADLRTILQKTGMSLVSCQESILWGRSTIVTPAFAKEVAKVIKDLNRPPAALRKSNVLQSIVLFLVLASASAWFYMYIDSRLDKLEELNFAPQMMRQIAKHTKEISE